MKREKLNGYAPISILYDQCKVEKAFKQRLFPHKKVQMPHRRKHRPVLVKFVQRNWLFIIIVIIVIVAVVYIFRNPQAYFLGGEKNLKILLVNDDGILAPESELLAEELKKCRT